MADAVSKLSARRKTVLLSVTLGVVALVLVVRGTLVEAHPLHGSRQDAWLQPVVVVALVVAFFLAEQYLVNIEFWRQSHSLTFAGVPLAVGIMLLPVDELVGARVVGSLLALLLQRISSEKVLYNISAWAFEAGVTGTIVHLWLPIGHQLTVAAVGGLLVCIAVIDQLMSGLVLWVIRIHGGPVGRQEVAEVLVPSFALSIVATVLGSALIALTQVGVVGDVLGMVLVFVAVAVYRTLAATARRHQSLETVHDFVTGGVGAATLEGLAGQSLSRIRQLMRAATVEMQLPTSSVDMDHPAWAAPTPHALRMSLSENDELTVSQLDVDPADWVQSKALHHGVPTLAARNAGDLATVRWLRARNLREAMVVPLVAGTEVLGAITVADRLGDVATFTIHDLSLLQTLTSHLAVAIRNTRLVEKLGYEASHDGLTGLVNRTYLSERISEAAAGAAVLLLDLDKFKEVNDILGHDVGDRLLVVIAERLQACLPKTATIARLGGDEFAVLLPGFTGPAATETARCAAAAILVPVRFEEAVLTPEVSIGISVTPGVAAADLLRCADTAMYVAKAGDRSVAVYEASMDSGRAERLALLVDLRITLDNHPHEFAVSYQPQVDLVTGEVVSAEALVRWHHRTLGVLPPDRFIPLAESSGLIEQLTEHVLAAALTECATWNASGHVMSVAVNLSPRNVADATLPARIKAALDRAKLAPHCLILEITESSVMQDPDRAVGILDDLVELGVSLSLDDFGTGYSSLSYLQRLPVAELKIDRSFVAGLGSDNTANARALIGSISALGANLGLRIVAEGIEERSQWDELRDLGCQIGQGYYIAQPQPSAEFRMWLDRRRPRSGELRLVPSRA